MDKSQIWSTDLAAGISIFLIVTIIFFVFTSHIAKSDESSFTSVYNDAIFVSGTLVGSEMQDTAALTNGDYRLNMSKLNYLSSIDYEERKLMFKTGYDYLIFFQNRSNEVMDINITSYIGKPGVNIDNLGNPNMLVTLKRFLLYNDDIITMVLYVWD